MTKGVFLYLMELPPFHVWVPLLPKWFGGLNEAKMAVCAVHSEQVPLWLLDPWTLEGALGVEWRGWPSGCPWCLTGRVASRHLFRSALPTL